MTEISGYATLDENGKVPVAQLGNMGALKITYAGTPQQPIIFNLTSGVAVLPSSPGPGVGIYGNNAPAILASNFDFSGMTSISFDDLASFGLGDSTLSIVASAGLTTLAFPELILIGCAAAFSSMSDLANLDLSSLQSIYGTLTIGNGLPNLTTIDLHSLAFCSDNSSGIFLNSLFGLTSIDISAYQQGGIDIDNCTSLTSLSANALVSAGAITFNENTLLSTVSFANLVNSALQIRFSNNPALTTLSFPQLATISGNFYFAGNSETLISAAVLTSISGQLYIDGENSLTTLTLSSLATIGTDLRFTNNAAITALTLDTVTTIGGDDGSQIVNNTLLASISMSSLASIGGALQIESNPALTAVDFSSLTSIGGDLNWHVNYMMASLPFVALASVQGIDVNNAGLTSLSLPALQSCSGLNCGDGGLNSISLPSLILCGDVSCGAGNIASVTLGTIGVLQQMGNIQLSGRAMTSASVNAILALLVSLDGTGGTTEWGTGQIADLSGGTNGAPTGQGVADAATLTGRGATVTTN